MSNVEQLKNEFALEGDEQETPPTSNDQGAAGNTALVRAGVIGAGKLGSTFAKMFSQDKVVVTTFDLKDDKSIDEAVTLDAGLYFVCIDVPFTETGFQKDAELIDICKKLDNMPGKPGIIVKSTLSPETIMRLTAALSEETMATRFVYAPELCDSSDFYDMLKFKHMIVGGAPQAVDPYIELIMRTTFLNSTNIMRAGVMEACFIKLGISGFIATQQTFWNEFYDCVSDYDASVNYHDLRRALGNYIDELDVSHLTMPTYIRSMLNEGTSFKKARSIGGEYMNNDIESLVSMTEKMPILDYIQNKKD